MAVEEGQRSPRASLWVVLEAMKMENPVTAHKSGVVTGLSVEAGAAVTKAPCCSRSNSLEPVEINAGTWYLRALRDTRCRMPGVGRSGVDDPAGCITRAADGWASETLFTWAVHPTTGELVALVTITPVRRHRRTRGLGPRRLRDDAPHRRPGPGRPFHRGHAGYEDRGVNNRSDLWSRP